MSLRDYKGFAPLVERIHQSIVNRSVSHAYIIEGDSFVDKTGFTKDFVKAVLCSTDPGYGCDSCALCRKIDHGNYEDLYFVQSDGMSVKDDMVFQLQSQLKGKPTGGHRNIGIIENADTMTTRAQNRLLKTLEEPNGGTILFLLCENTELLLPTIKSRCIIYRLGNYSQDEREINLELVEELMRMIIDGAYFCDFKDKLDKCVKDRNEAFSLIDAFERLFRGYLLNDASSPFRKEQLIENIRCAEEARRDLQRKVNYKYAIRNLILKIGG